MTIHRTMLQLYGVAVIVCFYGITLKLDRTIPLAAKESGTGKTRKRGKA